MPKEWLLNKKLGAEGKKKDGKLLLFPNRVGGKIQPKTTLGMGMKR